MFVIEFLIKKNIFFTLIKNSFYNIFSRIPCFVIIIFNLILILIFNIKFNYIFILLLELCLSIKNIIEPYKNKILFIR